MSLFSRGSKSFLPDREYLPMAMPTAGFDVLWILTRNGGALRRFGILSDVLTAQNLLSADAIRRDEITTNADRYGRKICQSWAFPRRCQHDPHCARREGRSRPCPRRERIPLSTHYTQVTADVVNLARLDAWLSGADLATGAGRVADLLVAERLYTGRGLAQSRRGHLEDA